MTNYPFKEIEQKEFNLKFSFLMLTKTIMFIQTVKSLYPDKNNLVNINCTNLEDEIEKSMKDIKELPVEERFKVLSMMTKLKKELKKL